MKKKQVALLLATTTGIATISIPNQNAHAAVNNKNKNTTNKVNIQDNNMRTNMKKGKVINVDTNLRIRKGTSINSEILGYLTNGQELDVIGQKGDWYEINHKGQIGYIYKDYAKVLDALNVKDIKNNLNKVSKSGNVINVDSHLNVRNNPNLSGSIIGKLNEGNVVEITSEGKDWYGINYKGQNAYVSKDYIKESKVKSPKIEKKQENKEFNKKSLDFSKGQVFNIGSNLRVRSGAGINNDVIGYLNNSESFNIKNKVGDWYQIEFNGHSGYVHKDYVKKASNDVINKLINKKTHSEKVQSKIEKVSNKGIIANIATNLRIRQGASENSAVLGYLVNGQNINIKGKAGDWYQIECDGKNGFINKKYVSLKGKLDVPSVNPNATNTKTPIKINKKCYGQVCNIYTNLRLRNKPNLNSDIVAYLLPNTTFEVIEKTNGWNKICCDGKVGYVADNFVKTIDEETAKKHVNNIKTKEVKHENTPVHRDTKPKDEKVKDNIKHNFRGYQAILNAMKSQVGTPYLFGGSGQTISQSVLNSLKSQFPYNASRGDYNLSSKFMNNKYRAFDCSGLMQWGFSQAGVSLGRTTWEQIGAGREVAKNSVQPGDLLFFKNIEHVGMYVGNGQWIEAPKHGDVVKITSVPWSRIGRARRVL